MKKPMEAKELESKSLVFVIREPLSKLVFFQILLFLPRQATSQDMKLLAAKGLDSRFINFRSFLWYVADD